MSLKAFHLVFIALSVVLAAFFAAWATGQYRVSHDVAYLTASVVSLLSGAALAVYAVAFQRKTKRI